MCCWLLFFPDGGRCNALTEVIGYSPAASEMEGIRGSSRSDDGIRGKPTVRYSVSFVHR